VNRFPKASIARRDLAAWLVLLVAALMCAACAARTAKEVKEHSNRPKVVDKTRQVAGKASSGFAEELGRDRGEEGKSRSTPKPPGPEAFSGRAPRNRITKRRPKPEPDYRVVRRIAADKARALGSAERVKICRLHGLEAWWLAVFVSGDRRIDVKQFVWHGDGETLEPILALKRIHRRQLAHELRRVEPDRSCEILTPRRSSTGELDWETVYVDKVTTRGKLKRVARLRRPVTAPEKAFTKRPKAVTRESAPPPPRGATHKGRADREKKEIMATLDRWKSGWESEDLDLLWQVYHPDFRSGNLDRERFLQSKKQFFIKYPTIRVALDHISIKKRGNRFIVDALRTFRGGHHQEKKWKRFVLVPGRDHEFRILKEVWLRK
jgi:hypothetical protein